MKYKHTITFETPSKPDPGDLVHLCAILTNKSNRCHREHIIKTEELRD